VPLTKQEVGQLGFSRLRAVFGNFVRLRRVGCKSRLQENIFACAETQKTARKPRNDFNICTRDARKTPSRNRQYADFAKLVKRAMEAPPQCPTAAIFLTNPPMLEQRAFGNSDYSLHFLDLVASTQALNCEQPMQPVDEKPRYAALKASTME
jgi:hypothetical protein